MAYFTTPDGNVTVTYESAGKKITEIYDHHYRLRDFLKPSIFELLLMSAEAPFVSLPVFALSNASMPERLGYALIPQLLTYVVSRGVELVGSGRQKWLIKRQKIPSPHRRLLERRVESLEKTIAE